MTHDDIAARHKIIRQVESDLDRPIGILADLQGPKLRVGTFANGAEELVEGAAFRVDLSATPGDATRGLTQFQTHCIVCHQAGSVAGIAVGPDLLTVKTRGRDGLLTAILEPHKEVAPQYIAYDVTTKDGNAYTGMITRDDATGLSLKIMGGAEVVLTRANVRGSTSSGKSLMPEGLEAGMSVQDMADLLTFIETL